MEEPSSWLQNDSMRCAKCGAENPKGKRFCGDCGTPLTNRCAQCGADSTPEKKFCGECGAALEGTRADPPAASAAAEIAHRTPAIPEQSGPAKSADGERRHLTVLFCDLVGSTEIAARLDPEEWHRIASQYQ